MIEENFETRVATPNTDTQSQELSELQAALEAEKRKGIFLQMETISSLLILLFLLGVMLFGMG